VIKKFALPQRCSRGRRPRLSQRAYRATSPTLPITNKVGQSLCAYFRSAKEVNMIGHDDISPNSPSMTFMSRPPLFLENSGCFVSSENSFSSIDARGDVIDRKIDPNAFKPSQMFMHSRMFVAEGVDLGEPKDLPRAQSPRSAPAATASARQKRLPDPALKFFLPQASRSG